MKGKALVFKVMVAASAISAAVTLVAYFMAIYVGGPWVTDYLAFKINISLALVLVPQLGLQGAKAIVKQSTSDADGCGCSR